ncbi:NAD(P)/FAD-dependent oxidoreductase [Marinobacter sp. F4216]|uniref:NAD(P)/FAD-dependent oxidoreductase n=1 Tax=Marinobacter sp. F4216 TaxID=2874281 RepID=UPI001CBF7063|nr:FAD-dependent oxidoreductase [Marinobacter sp. F4216]MBZ2169445.1 FAD-binding oxidoreductase [Marinobacter sp. F4216]
MNQSAFPFTEGSFWLEAPDDIQPALRGQQRCDVAIIGGGYTGLSAALRLRERGVDVALLEKDYCGFGASGRSAGHVTPTVGKDIPSCIRRYGMERGMAYVRFAEQAVAEFESLIHRHGIDCDYQPTGNIVAGVHETHRAKLMESAESVGKLGIRMHYLDETAMRERGLPPAFRFGVHEDCGGTIHPGKYVLGLRSAALKAGVRIYEHSPVSRIDEGSTVSLYTGTGVLKAPQVMLATNAYAPAELGLMKSRILPVRVSQFTTRPLTDAELESIGWPNREGIYTAHEMLENYRLTADRRIVGGSKVIHYAYGSRLADGYQPSAFRTIEQAFRDRLPELRNVPIETYWGGWVAMTLDFLPVNGNLGAHRNIAYYAGCNGHGIPQCSLMGGALADWILSEDTSFTKLFQRIQIPFPPEPLRWAVLKSLNALLAWSDQRIDHALRRA